MNWCIGMVDGWRWISTCILAAISFKIVVKNLQSIVNILDVNTFYSQKHSCKKWPGIHFLVSELGYIFLFLQNPWRNFLFVHNTGGKKNKSKIFAKRNISNWILNIRWAWQIPRAEMLECYCVKTSRHAKMKFHACAQLQARRKCTIWLKRI